VIIRVHHVVQCVGSEVYRGTANVLNDNGSLFPLWACHWHSVTYLDVSRIGGWLAIAGLAELKNYMHSSSHLSIRAEREHRAEPFTLA
jgi:hypothetical protein